MLSSLAGIQPFDVHYDLPDSHDAGGRLLLPKVGKAEVALASFSRCAIALCKTANGSQVSYWGVS